MNDADKAHAAAEHLIEEAKKKSLVSLDLDTPETNTLDRLPPSIAELPRLLGLTLNTGHHALSGLSQLSSLGLNNTRVGDLRPLLALTRFATDPTLNGLTFRNCLAAQQDAEFERISEIENHRGRAQTSIIPGVGFLSAMVLPAGVIGAQTIRLGIGIGIGRDTQ